MGSCEANRTEAYLDSELKRLGPGSLIKSFEYSLLFEMK